MDREKDESAPRAFRVLMADDEDVSRKRLESALRKRGYDVVSVSDGNQAWEELAKENAPRLAILDWMMPGLSGLDICRKLRETNREPYVYVMLLTGKDSKSDLIAGLDAGADDYLTKPFNAQELEVRLRAGRRIVELQSDLILARERLRYQALHDVLTGVDNRAAIDDGLEREISRARRTGLPLSIVMIDLDFFKKVNDRFGHVAGDEVLRTAATRFKSQLRAYDILGRFGGEEFLVLLPACDVEGAQKVAERLRASLADEPIVLGAESIQVTCSLGVVHTRAPAGLDGKALISMADTALYAAKHAGRNRVMIAATSRATPPELETGAPASSC